MEEDINQLSCFVGHPVYKSTELHTEYISMLSKLLKSDNSRSPVFHLSRKTTKKRGTSNSEEMRSKYNFHNGDLLKIDCLAELRSSPAMSSQTLLLKGLYSVQFTSN